MGTPHTGDCEKERKKNIGDQCQSVSESKLQHWENTSSRQQIEYEGNIEKCIEQSSRYSGQLLPVGPLSTVLLLSLSLLLFSMPLPVFLSFSLLAKAADSEKLRGEGMQVNRIAVRLRREPIRGNSYFKQCKQHSTFSMNEITKGLYGNSNCKIVQLGTAR